MEDITNCSSIDYIYVDVITRKLGLENMEDNLIEAERSAAVGNATGAVSALLSAHRIANENIREYQGTIDDMKNVFSETRVPGYLTDENRYFEREQTLELGKWLTSLTEILLEYARKNGLEIIPIQKLLNESIDYGYESSIGGE